MGELPILPISAKPEDERRRSPRYEIDLQVRAAVRSGGITKSVHGRGNDLSTNGMSALLPIDLSIGQTLEFRVTLPYCSQPLMVRAVVRNRRSFLYGLEFAHLTVAQRREIENACRSLSLVR